MFRFFSLLNYHSCDNIVEKLLCDNIVEKLKTGNNFNQTIFCRRLNFRRKKIIRLVETKSFLRVNFRRKKNICLLGTKSFLDLIFAEKRLFVSLVEKERCSVLLLLLLLWVFLLLAKDDVSFNSS